MPPLATKSDEKMEKFKSVGLRHGANPMRKSKSKRFFALDLQKKYVSKIIYCKLKLSLSFCRRDYRWLRPRRPRRHHRLHDSQGVWCFKWIATELHAVLAKKNTIAE